MTAEALRQEGYQRLKVFWHGILAREQSRR